jgi:hypothetical protein
MDVFIYTLVTLAGIYLFGYALRRLVDSVSFPRHFCRQNVRAFSELDENLKRDILSCFHQYERRDPDETGLFVCANC